MHFEKNHEELTTHESENLLKKTEVDSQNLIVASAFSDLLNITIYFSQIVMVTQNTMSKLLARLCRQYLSEPNTGLHNISLLGDNCHLIHQNPFILPRV